MASTGVDFGTSANFPDEKTSGNNEKRSIEDVEAPSDEDSIKPNRDSTHRKLRPRHIQLIGIGGTIGTALFVSIGRGLLNGGPASLFMAFTIW